MTGTANNITYIQYIPQGFLPFDVITLLYCVRIPNVPADLSIHYYQIYT